MKLKPCPFCGGEAKIVNVIGTFNDEPHEHWRIRCKNINCDVRPSTSWFIAEEEAIDRWNRRKPMDKIVEQLEAEFYGDLDAIRVAFDHGIRTAIEIVKGGAE